MFRLFCGLSTRRYIVAGIAVIFAVGSLPGIAVACEGAAEEAEPKESEGLEEEKGPPCVNMVFEDRCFLVFMAGTDEVEIEAGRIEEEPGRRVRYEKSQEGCTPGLRLRKGVRGREGCLDVVKVILQETGRDHYTWVYANIPRRMRLLTLSESMSIR